MPPFISDQETPPSSLRCTPRSLPRKSRPRHRESGRTQLTGSCGRVPLRSLHVAPRSLVARTYGRRSPCRYPVTVRYAARASNGSAAISVTQYGGPGGLTLVQAEPASALTQTLPSSVPAHRTWRSTGETLTTVIVPRTRFIV